MRTEATITRPLPRPCSEDELPLWPVADTRLRTHGFLADLDVRTGIRPHLVAETLSRFSVRWRRLTGRHPELHLRIAGLPDGSPEAEGLPASLASLRATGQVLVWRGREVHAHGAGGWRVDEASSAWGVVPAGAAPTSPMPRMLRVDSTSTAADGRSRTQVVLTDVDDLIHLQAARRRRPWRLAGAAVGGPDTTDGWCWWAVGLGVGEAPAVRRPRSRRWGRQHGATP